MKEILSVGIMAKFGSTLSHTVFQFPSLQFYLKPGPVLS